MNRILHIIAAAWTSKNASTNVMMRAMTKEAALGRFQETRPTDTRQFRAKKLCHQIRSTS
jgi:hypothetical protein